MINRLIRGLFKTSISEKKILIKEIFLTDDNENILRTIKMIRKSFTGSYENNLILDIGAFDGTTSKSLSKAFPECRILAFEPNTEAYKVAANNLKNNNKISLKNIAISDKTESSILFVTSNSVSSSLNNINQEEVNTTQSKNEFEVKKEQVIQTETLDHLHIKNEILLLKIDTQGHEMNVLKGAQNTLNSVSYILIEMSNHEIYTGSSKYYEIDGFLRTAGFSLADIIVTYRKNGILATEFDAIYVNKKKNILI